ncbi:hypothetical protein HK101_005835 [Irineochytrium annulatum]|nr:hypothetical protein HK101_005835 [Irineochytrium annulatum]
MPADDMDARQLGCLSVGSTSSNAFAMRPITGIGASGASNGRLPSLSRGLSVAPSATGGTMAGIHALVKNLAGAEDELPPNIFRVETAFESPPQPGRSVATRKPAQARQDDADGPEIVIMSGHRPPAIKASFEMEADVATPEADTASTIDVPANVAAASVPAQLEDSKLSSFTVRFVSRKLESRFRSHHNLIHIKKTRLLAAILSSLLLFYMLDTFASPPKQLAELAAQTHIANPPDFFTLLASFVVVASSWVVAQYGRESFIKKWLHIYLRAVSLWALLMLMCVDQYFVALYIGNDPDTFEPYVRVSYQLLLLSTICVCIPGYMTCLMTSTAAIILNWGLVMAVIKAAHWDNYLSILSLYGLTATSAVGCTREREWRDRRIFLMEETLSAQCGMSVDSLARLPTKLVLSAGLSDVWDPKPHLVAVKGLRARVWRKVVDALVLTWSDGALEKEFFKWGNKLFVRRLKYHMVMLTAGDIAGAFLDMGSYCNLPAGLADSPSLCGDRGILVRNVRLAFAPLIGLMMIVSILPLNLGRHVTTTSWIVTAMFMLRGLLFIVLCVLIGKWDSSDQTVRIFVW